MAWPSAKWNKLKTNAFVMETVARENAIPNLYQFLGLAEDEETVSLRNLQTGEEVKINSDDRYGHYPIVTAARIGEMRYRLQNLKAEVKKYNHILKLIDNADI